MNKLLTKENNEDVDDAKNNRNEDKKLFEVIVPNILEFSFDSDAKERREDVLV
jgi:hypothetical protein